MNYFKKPLPFLLLSSLPSLASADFFITDIKSMECGGDVLALDIEEFGCDGENGQCLWGTSLLISGSVTLKNDLATGIVDVAVATNPGSEVLQQGFYDICTGLISADVADSPSVCPEKGQYDFSDSILYTWDAPVQDEISWFFEVLGQDDSGFTTLDIQASFDVILDDGTTVPAFCTTQVYLSNDLPETTPIDSIQQPTEETVEGGKKTKKNNHIADAGSTGSKDEDDHDGNDDGSNQNMTLSPTWKIGKMKKRPATTSKDEKKMKRGRQHKNNGPRNGGDTRRDLTLSALENGRGA